ncbi:FAD/NAD-P-binding domain-containing protein [Fomitopsis serialis]|uniref:FAD/NAD-P-binding domain-containing protein n=1 Tax=Fomitopsis serialis TaxID=139415 RepID=UPI0020075B18|nr:FAD/NAD-P-binding domain-containing protein [Neoantrodia serialis]KAH9917071.1 FAD/NAD-P-binding domain-containing protein [Neoantrodia serialis]
MEYKPAVLIVGAGPTGLVLALSLLKNGVPIRIIEKSSVPHGGARGTAIQPRTLELLAFLGAVNDVFAISTPPLLMATHGTGQEVLKITRWEQDAGPSPHIPYPRVASSCQAEFEKVLRKHIEKLGAKVEYGVELTTFEQHAHGVVAHLRVSSKSGDATSEETVECAYMVGGDGAKGHIRKSLGLSFLGETKEAERMFTANVDVDGLDGEYWHTWGTFNTAGFALKPLKPAPLFQVQALGPDLPDTFPTDTEGIQRLFESISGSQDIALSNAAWVSTWKANIRMANTFSVGRVFLAGDSAHCHSPAGGQGANTAMQDAFNLAWKLALVIRGLASPALLRTYDAERVPVVAEMLSLSTELHSLAFNRPRASAVDAGEEISNDKAMFRPRKLLQLGINYRWSPIVLEARAGEDDASANDPYGQETSKLRAGDRAPDATPLIDADNTSTGVITLHSTFSVEHHTIIAFPSAADTLAILEPLTKHVDVGLARISVVHRNVPGREMRIKGSRALVDVEGTAHAGYDVHGDGLSFVVIRPDGIIGAYTHGMAGIDRYFAALQGFAACQ